MNIFKFNHIHCEQFPRNNSRGEVIMFLLRVEIEAHVSRTCNGCGLELGRLKLHTYGEGYDENEALRRALELLLNHKYDRGYEFNARGCSCDLSDLDPREEQKLNRMQYDFSGWPAHWQELFNQLFTDANWVIAKKEIGPA